LRVNTYASELLLRFCRYPRVVGMGQSPEVGAPCTRRADHRLNGGGSNAHSHERSSQLTPEHVLEAKRAKWQIRCVRSDRSSGRARCWRNQTSPTIRRADFGFSCPRIHAIQRGRGVLLTPHPWSNKDAWVVSIAPGRPVPVVNT